MLFHRELGIPANLMAKLAGATLALNFSRHAMLECVRDKRGVIQPPKQVTLTPANIVEVESDTLKTLVRLPYKVGLDLVLAILPERGIGEATVKTCWLNETTDAHSTLDKSKYATA